MFFRRQLAAWMTRLESFSSPTVPRRLAHAAGRGPRRLTRYAAAALVLGLGLNGLGRCLCTPTAAKTCDVKPCCAAMGSHHGFASGSGTSLAASVTTCCASGAMRSGVAARLDDRDIQRHAVAAMAAVTSVSQHVPRMPATIRASLSLLRPSSPPIALRI